MKQKFLLLGNTNTKQSFKIIIIYDALKSYSVSAEEGFFEHLRRLYVGFTIVDNPSFITTFQ